MLSGVGRGAAKVMRRAIDLPTRIAVWGRAARQQKGLGGKVPRDSREPILGLEISYRQAGCPIVTAVCYPRPRSAGVETTRVDFLRHF